MRLLDAIRDDDLLAPALAGPSWLPWHAFLRAVDALPLTGADLDLYRRCTGRTRPPTTPAREVYAIVGRRGGKSRLAAALAVEAPHACGTGVPTSPWASGRRSPWSPPTGHRAAS